MNIWKGTRSVVTALSLLTLLNAPVAMAREPNLPQRVVIHVDRMARDVHKAFFKTDRQKFFDKFMPVDDFRLYLKPKFGKSFVKGKAYYTIGFKFTF